MCPCLLWAAPASSEATARSSGHTAADRSSPRPGSPVRQARWRFLLIRSGSSASLLLNGPSTARTLRETAGAQSAELERFSIPWCSPAHYRPVGRYLVARRSVVILTGQTAG